METRRRSLFDAFQQRRLVGKTRQSKINHRAVNLNFQRLRNGSVR
jgi:hypothetical protein